MGIGPGGQISSKLVSFVHNNPFGGKGEIPFFCQKDILREVRLGGYRPSLPKGVSDTWWPQRTVRQATLREAGITS